MYLLVGVEDAFGLRPALRVEDLRLELVLVLILLVFYLAVPGNSVPEAELEAGLDEALLQDLRAEDDGGLVHGDLDGGHGHLELVLEKLLQVFVCYVWRHLIKDDGSLGLVTGEERGGRDLGKSVLVLVGSLDVLAVESTAYAQLQH